MWQEMKKTILNFNLFNFIMKTFFKNLLNMTKWRFLTSQKLVEMPDKFTKMHNEFLEKESNKVIDNIPITINIPKTKKIKKRERKRMFTPTKELVKTYNNTPKPIKTVNTYIDLVVEQLEVLPKVSMQTQ